MDGVCVAFSGGVDSTFLLRVARDVLGERVIAVTATSPTYPESELREAIELAESMNVRHLVISSNELEIPGFSENSTNRCYHCKNELFRKLKTIAEEHGIGNVVDGSNHDDTRDFRPGRRAARELGVRSPLSEAGLTKKEIRYLSKQLGLRTWNKPSFACLSSRFPYGERITEEKLRKVERAERFLRELGFTQFRVRHHNGIARLEFLPEEMSFFNDADLRVRIDTELKRIGFNYVTVDLLGYRTGSMNEVIKTDEV
ncbi:MAG: ATP-dependent sacrificial sulfur transferase LarE [Nitrospirae bacterium]|nr:ATP-dependent sacrificial sulfur transferase LarE [Nitrospirota bacterium]